MSTPQTVETTHGTLRGLTAEGVHVFKGIPYAAPPVGRRRFASPVPLASWSGIRDTFEYGARAIQPATGLGLAPPIQELLVLADPQPMNEDCLFLNIWTPALDDGGKRPVMVWLHGGAFIAGSGGSPMYDGTSFARNEDVVVVTLNHRLGLLGYLNLAELGGADFSASGNAGMLDIVAALRWIRDNIAQFGGDPGNVTLFGESGGGAKICVLMAMPEAQGLFHKAIIQSGPAVEMMSSAASTEVARRIFAYFSLDAKNPALLYDVPAEDLLEAQMVEVRARGPMTFANRRKIGFNPVIDGCHLPGGPFEPVAPSISAQIPLMIGTNRDELTLFWALAPWVEGLDEARLVELAGGLVGERAAHLIAAYRRAQPQASLRDLLTAIGSDQAMRLPSLLIAERKLAQQAAPVFVYLFTWGTPVLEGRLKSCHALEIPFVFDTIDKATRLTGTAPERGALAAIMRKSWAQFARSGDPNNAALQRWPSYDTARRPTMIFDTSCRLASDPMGDERRAWG